MSVVKKYAEEENCWSSNWSDQTIEFTHILQEKIGNLYIYIYSKFSRKNCNIELSWRFVYNIMSKKGEFNI